MERTSQDMDRGPATGDQPLTTADLADRQPSETSTSAPRDTNDEYGGQAVGETSTTTGRETMGAGGLGADAPSGDGSTSDRATAGAAATSPRTDNGTGAGEPLVDEATSSDMRSRWESIQASFVDEPRAAVEQADGLVAEVLQNLARSFKTQRESLEKEWQLGDDVSTEDLRQALRHYRSFFDRLLSL